MTQKFINNYSTTVAQTFGSGDTYLRVASPVGLPVLGVGEYFLLTVFRKVGQDESGHEVVKVTEVVSDQLTVQRSIEGAATSTFIVGDRVEARLTAGTLDSFTDTAQAAAAAPVQSVAGKTGAVTLAKGDVGLGNVDNTSDADKPVSTAQQNALNLKADLSHVGTGGASHALAVASGAAGFMSGGDKAKLDGIASGATANTGTVTGVTGTAPVVSSGGAAPVISMAAATASVNGYMTSTYAAKLDGIAAGANNYSHPASHPPSIITQDASNRFVTDAEKSAWNAKGDVTLAGVQTLTNKTLTGYTETVYNLVGTDIAVANGTIQTKTLSANTTFTESLADGQSVILGITAGAYSVTWPSVTWTKVGGSGVAPTLTSSGVNWIILWQVGGVLRGSFMGTA